MGLKKKVRVHISKRKMLLEVISTTDIHLRKNY